MENKKKVLIVGKGSFIGTSFFDAYKDAFDIKIIDSFNELNIKDYYNIDSVFHVAGIAHASTKNNKKINEKYMKVNRDLAIESAKLARDAGCKHFIFMSSMIIYGKDQNIWKPFLINENTKPNPEGAYGRSKLEADLFIKDMNSDSFKTCVIRTPMVYGENCKGNYQKLKKLAKYLFIIPDIKNERTVIRIETLVNKIAEYISNFSSGVFYPREDKPMSTTEELKRFRKQYGKKVRKTKCFNWLIYFASIFINSLKKMYSSKKYLDLNQ